VLGDFAKADATWLDPLLDAIADNVALLLKGDDNGFMNKIALAVPGSGKRSGEADASAAPRSTPKGQSHIRQARPAQPQVKVPETGPMAAMLKKLLGRD
jgi:PTH1 family peptidyl-tRNA hydrolase